MNRHSFWFLLITLTLATSPAIALPCLSKGDALRRAVNPHYRIVDGQRCWYVVDYVPSKAEFIQPKRKEVVDRARLAPLTEEKAAAPVARAQVVRPPVQLPPAVAEEVWVPPAEWFLVDREAVIDALCGTSCLVVEPEPPPAYRIQDAFDGLRAMIMFDRRGAESWRAALVGH